MRASSDPPTPPFPSPLPPPLPSRRSEEPCAYPSTATRHCHLPPSLRMPAAMARIADSVSVSLLSFFLLLFSHPLLFAGLGFHGDLASMDLAASDKVLQRLMQVNAIGPSLLSQYCAKKMLLSPTRKKVAPTLLLLSSYSGIVGLPHRAAYCASKFALNGYLETVHAEFPDLRIASTIALLANILFLRSRSLPTPPSLPPLLPPANPPSREPSALFPLLFRRCSFQVSALLCCVPSSRCLSGTDR